MADLLSNMKTLVTFIRASPKRVQIFKNIQCHFNDEDDKQDDEDDHETQQKLVSDLKRLKTYLRGNVTQRC